MNKREFYNNLVTNLSLADRDLHVHANTDGYGNPYKVTAFKPFDFKKGTFSNNVISVKCYRNIVTIYENNELLEETDWNKHYKPNMVAITAERVLELIK